MEIMMPVPGRPHRARIGAGVVLADHLQDVDLLGAHLRVHPVQEEEATR
jgi:2-keto-3-deoxy-6-phosphogluconate aldolase